MQPGKFTTRGLGIKRLTQPAFPTFALPGSKEKLEVMIERVEHGESPHHPNDARDTDDGPGLDAMLALGVDVCGKKRSRQGRPTLATIIA